MHRLTEDDRELTRRAVVEILWGLDAALWQAASKRSWICGSCGCLCVDGETCPKCRADVMAHFAHGVAS